MSLHFRVMIVALIPVFVASGLLLGWGESVVVWCIGAAVLEVFAAVEDVRARR